MSLTFAIADTRVSLPAHSTLALMRGAEPLPSLASIDEVHDALWWVAEPLASLASTDEIEDGILQKNITILCNETVLDEEESGSTHPPMYIDVHFQSYSRLRWSAVKWSSSLARYKIQYRPSAMAGNALAINKGLSKGCPPDVHTRNGCQTLCWGYHDDSDGNWNILLLLATVESDNGPHDLMLQGLSDKWVGRGIHNACGLHLARDAEERECAQEQQEEAKGYDDDSEDDENGDDDSKYSL
ncbi:hypothetical protein EDB19DRAFT_1906658 [Suillus lakei]|nr:hypothetical protein EDB19DRAFT_1906658 [Suillus lakei]